MTSSPSSLTPHFFEDIANLKHELVSEGEIVKVRLSRAMQGLMERDLDLLDEVAIGDADVNALQIAIDDRAFKLLALHQPVAIDLRVIVAASKINSDLERVGDLAVNIAEAARRYFAAGRSIEMTYLPRMMEIAETMLENALQAFVSGSIGLAESVLERDDALDSLRVQAYRHLVHVMTSDAALVPAALELMSIARHLERIGDHATNIAEDVFFIIAGEDVRAQALIPFPPQRSESDS
jgi:phosphate transport system protein